MVSHEHYRTEFASLTHPVPSLLRDRALDLFRVPAVPPVPSSPFVSRDVALRLINKPGPEHPSHVAARLTSVDGGARSERVDGECMRAFVAAGRVVLMELRPDGTPGIELHIPREEFAPEMAEEFERKIRRKHGRLRVKLVR